MTVSRIIKEYRTPSTVCILEEYVGDPPYYVVKTMTTRRYKSAERAEDAYANITGKGGKK